ncbi:MAG: hypothetical protein VXZ78_06955, partial [Pseudomonadota bacterium]|nr:hypothetical protein [Pseudomonadota bacterium]
MPVRLVRRELERAHERDARARVGATLAPPRPSSKWPKKRFAASAASLARASHAVPSSRSRSASETRARGGASSASVRRSRNARTVTAALCGVAALRSAARAAARGGALG